MRTAVLTILLTFLFPFCLVYAQESNAGIVQGLWYGNEKVFADKTVRIYVAIRNNTGSDLSGTVEFFDNATRIDRKTVQALDGRIIESWADWTPQYGTHLVKASLSRIELHSVGTTTEEVTVVSALAEDDIFVDYDTDGDNIGNKDDTDDDGDGITDEEEVRNGTDPLIKNAPTKQEATAPDRVDENTDDIQPQEEDDSENARRVRINSNDQQGLEQYLAPSPAETALAQTTTFINSTKSKLDTYREHRETKQESTASSSKPEVNEDGFGEVTRSTDEKKSFIPEGFFDNIIRLFVSLINTVYTFVLSILSFILGHPILVQVGLLLLILFGLIKFASRFGRRPKGYSK